MKQLTWIASVAGFLGLVAGCSPAKQKEQTNSPVTEQAGESPTGMRAWGESTTAVAGEVEMPASESAPVASDSWDPGLMQPSEPSSVPQMWGADGSQPGAGLPKDVPVMQGANDPLPGESKAAPSPVPVLQSPADLMKSQGTPPPVLQSPADLIGTKQQ
jgi:hypothetical protein